MINEVPPANQRCRRAISSYPMVSPEVEVVLNEAPEVVIFDHQPASFERGPTVSSGCTRASLAACSMSWCGPSADCAKSTIRCA